MDNSNHTQNPSIRDALALGQALADINEKAAEITHMAAAITALVDVDEFIDFEIQAGESDVPAKLRTDFVRGGLRVAIQALADRIDTFSEQIEKTSKNALGESSQPG